MKPTLIDRCPGCGKPLHLRSTDQNSKLHALIQDIAEQKEWAGQKWAVEDWKRLLVCAWERASGGHTRPVPALDGVGFDLLYRRTSRMTKEELSDLLEFVQAWAVDQGVRLRDAA